MIKVFAAITSEDKIIRHEMYSCENENMEEALLDCLETVCKKFDIEMPMWHTQHTKQLALFRKITFRKSDFIDAFPYDRFTLELI